MVTSKKYRLVSLVLGLSVAHGANAASAGVSLTDGTDVAAPSAPVQASAAAVGSFTLLTPTDLLKYSTTSTTYTRNPDLEIEMKRQLGTLDFTSSGVVSLATAAELLRIIKPLTDFQALPFQADSAIANVKAAYRALRGLLEYQMYLKANSEAFQCGETKHVEPLNMKGLFAFDPSDIDSVTQTDPERYKLEKPYTPLDNIKNLFVRWAEDSKKLGDIFKGNQIRASLGSVGGQAAAAVGLPPEAAAAASAAVSAFVEGLSRGAEKAAGTESPSLFNPEASVRDNVVALYRYVTTVRDHIRESYDGYMAASNAKLQADVAAYQAAVAAAQAAAAEAVTNASRDRQARESIQGLLDAKKQELAAQAQDLSAARAALAEAQAAPRLMGGAAAAAPLVHHADSVAAFATLFDQASELEGLLAQRDAEIARVKSETGLIVAKVTGENAALKHTLALYLKK